MSRFWTRDRFWVWYRWFFIAFSLAACIWSIFEGWAFSAALIGMLLGLWLRESDVQAERKLSRGWRHLYESRRAHCDFFHGGSRSRLEDL